MKRVINLMDFQRIYRSFIKSSHLEDRVASNTKMFIDTSKEVSGLLKAKGFEFTENVNDFLSSLTGIQNKTLNKLGKSNLKDLVY